MDVVHFTLTDAKTRNFETHINTIGSKLKERPQEYKCRISSDEYHPLYFFSHFKKKIPCISSYIINWGEADSNNVFTMTFTRKDKKKNTVEVDGKRVKLKLQETFDEIVPPNTIIRVKPYLYATGELNDPKTEIVLKADLWISSGYWKTGYMSSKCASNIFRRCTINLHKEEIFYEDETCAKLLEPENKQHILKLMSEMISNWKTGK